MQIKQTIRNTKNFYICLMQEKENKTFFGAGAGEMTAGK